MPLPRRYKHIGHGRVDRSAGVANMGIAAIRTETKSESETVSRDFHLYGERLPLTPYQRARLAEDRERMNE